MSKPRYHWWGYVKWVIRDYPNKREELASMKSAKMTANYSAMPRSSEPGRGTERIATMGFAGQKRREFEAVLYAIEKTKALPGGKDRLKMMDLVFWKQTHTLQGAAMSIPVCYRTACEWHGAFIRTVAVQLGLMDEKDETSERFA